MAPFQAKLSNGTRRLVTPAKGVELDAKAMSARAVFASDSLDRVGDILRVPGIDTANHAKNPVVLFDHGKWFGWPVGKTVSPDGAYTVELAEHEAYQTTFFAQSLLEGEQTFRLIEEGVISANSIGYRPLKAKKLQAQAGQLQKPGLYLEQVELLEVSWVGVPANQDCIRAALARSQVCGKSLSPLIRQALAPLVLPTKPLVRGGFSMPTPTKSATKADPTDETVAAPPATEGDGAPTPDAPAPDAPKIPLGAQLLTSVHGHLLALVEYAQTEGGALENVDVESFLLEMVDDIFEKLSATEAMYAAQYPDLEKLPESKAPDAKDEKPEEKPAEGDEPAEKDDPKEGEKPEGSDGKSYSGSAKRFTKAAGNTIRECADHLGEMSGAENLDKSQKVACKYYAKALGELVQESEAAPAKTEPDGDENLTPQEKVLAEQKIKRLELLVQHKKRLARQKALRGK